MGLRFCSLNRDRTGFCCIGAGGQRSLVPASHVPGAGPGPSGRRPFGGLSFASLLLCRQLHRSLYGGFASFLVCTLITSWRGWQLEETVAGDHHQLLWGRMMPFGVTVSYSGGKVLERIKSERAVYGFKQDRGPY